MNLDIVIVTYNRLEKLKNALLHYLNQTKPFRNLIIVNNCSNDGTNEFLCEWVATIEQQGCPKFSPIIINTQENLGGSGGFYLGQKKAMELGADWVMVADDDAYAEPDMVETFYRYHESRDCSKLSAICAVVKNTDGEIVFHHRERLSIKDGKFYSRNSSVQEDYLKESFSIDFFSYVGTFLNGNALNKQGLVNPRYFIYFDDSEHSLRMKKYGHIVVVPTIQIIHDDCAKSFQDDSNIVVSWRDYYLSRNQFHMLLMHFPLIALRYFWWQLRDWYLGRIEQTPSHKVDNEAKWDAVLGRLGKNKKYKPGWQIQKR